MHTLQDSQPKSTYAEGDENEKARITTLQQVLDEIPKKLAALHYDHGHRREFRTLTFSSEFEFITNYGVFEGQRRTLRQFRPLLKKAIFESVPRLESISIDIKVYRMEDFDENDILYSSDYLCVKMRGRFSR